MKHTNTDANAKYMNARSYTKRMATIINTAVHQKLQTNDCILTTAVISSSSFSFDKAMNTNDTSRPSIQISFTGSVTVIPNHSLVLARSRVKRAGTLTVSHSPSQGPHRSQDGIRNPCPDAQEISSQILHTGTGGRISWSLQPVQLYEDDHT